MKKVLVLSLLVAGLCFGDDAVAAHERQMTQMRDQTGDGSMNQVKTQERKQERIKTKNTYEGTNASSSSETGKQYKGTNPNMQSGMGGGGMGGGKGSREFPKP